MTGEDYKALPYALVGAAEGIWRYYLRPAPLEGIKWLGQLIFKDEYHEKPELWEDRFFDN